MTHNQKLVRPVTHHRALASTAAAIATVVPLLLSAAPASAETRGYVISWFAVATNNPDFAVNCPKTIQQQISRIGKPRDNQKAFANGKEVASLDYPDALQGDPSIELVSGKYAYGFDLGGSAASKFEDPDTHDKVDNQLWRAVGCTANFQFTPPVMPYLEGQAWNSGYADAAPAWAMQITGADLTKDGPVTVTLDRTLSHLERDALAGVRSDVTYVIDPSPRSHNVLNGEIKDGMLWIKTGSIYLEGSLPFYSQIDLVNTHMRMGSGVGGKLVGYWGGYTDWHIWSYMYTSRCVVADCVGQYRLLKKLADYDADPATGQNRKISLTYRMEAVPAYLATEDGKIIGTSTTAGLGGKVQAAFASNASSAQTPPTAAQ